MLARVLKVGLLAGLLAGLAIALLQQATTTPLIRIAETYENVSAAKPAATAAADHHDGGHVHEHGEGWKPEDGLPRFFFTTIATVATAVGISFLLLAAMLVSGTAIDRQSSLAWALAGFVAAGLAPAAGLSPELPGGGGGDLAGRQIWWIGTAFATAAALWLFLRTDKLVVRLAAIVLLALPHLIGAPQPHAFESKVPAELAAHFTALSLVVQGLLWVVVGVGVGLFWPRFAPKASA